LSVSGPDDQEVLLVSVPKFSQAATCVLVNLRTLDCQPMEFTTQFTLPMDTESPEIDKWHDLFLCQLTCMTFFW
jgi:DNA polymerase delta subunit 2